LLARSLHSVHQDKGRLESQLKRHPETTCTFGSKAANARAAVDFAVPLSPRINTPPIRGLIAFRINARSIRSCPTIAVKGKIVGILYPYILIYLLKKFTTSKLSYQLV
jgi:hypothetical protein